MALSVATGTLQVSTAAAGNTVAVTGLGFQPRVILFAWAGRTGTGSSQLDSKFGMGYAVSATDRGGVTTQNDHGNSTIAAHHDTFDDACVKFLHTDGTLLAALDLQSMDSDGFTLEIDDASPTDYRVHWLALGGADLTDAASDTVSFGASGTIDLTTLGFQPDCALIFGGLSNSVNAPDGSSVFSFGVADTALNNYVLAGSSQNGLPTSASKSYSLAGECYATVFSGDVFDRVAATAWLSGGVRFNKVEHNITSVARVLCLKGASFHAGDILSQTGTSNTAETGVGFAPLALLFASDGKAAAAADTNTAHDKRSIGFATGPTARNYCGLTDRDAAGTATCLVSQNVDAFFINTTTGATPALDALADLVSLDADGFTFVMDDADAAQNFVWYLAVGAAAGGGAFTLAADSGTFVLTGTAASLERGLRLAASSGTFALAGTAASLERGLRLAAESGSFALAGQDADLVWSGEGAFALDAEAGAFALSGTAAGLLVARRLSAEAGVFALTGTATSLEVGRRLVADSATFALVGTAAGLEVGRVLVADAGAFALAGQDADFARTRVLVAAAGAFALTGTAASLTYTALAGPTPAELSASPSATAELTGRASPDAATLSGSSASTLDLTGTPP